MLNLEEYVVRHRAATQTAARLKDDLERTEREVRVTAAGKAAITSAAAACQQAAYDGVAACVTRCLKAVFGDEAYRCELEVKTERGRPACRFRFYTPDGDLIDPMTASAGGEVDVIAFALRVAAVAIARPPGRRLLVLDEPMKHLDRGRAEAARELILALAKDLDMQVVFSTHSPDLACGRVEPF